MKILKTSALSTVIALTAFSANATYDNSADFDVQITTAEQLQVTIASTITMDDLIDGDQIDIDIPVVIAGDTTVGSGTVRAITCTLGGGADSVTAVDITSSGTTVDFELRQDGVTTSASAAKLTMSLDSDCDVGSFNINANSSALSGTVANSNYSTGDVTFTAIYTVNTAIATYS